MLALQLVGLPKSFFNWVDNFTSLEELKEVRRGLTDTAVKIAETGYMQRGPDRALDICVLYDNTVHGSTESVV